MAKNLVEKLGDELATYLAELTFKGYNTIPRPETTEKSIVQIEEFTRRIEYVKYIVSLWRHASMVDGELAESEETTVGMMMYEFFGGEDTLFPANEVDVDAVFAELAETFCAPETISDVVLFACAYPQLPAVFFEEACCIVASDGKVHQKERLFLDALATRLALSPELQNEIETRFISEIETT